MKPALIAHDQFAHLPWFHGGSLFCHYVSSITPHPLAGDTCCRDCQVLARKTIENRHDVSIHVPPIERVAAFSNWECHVESQLFPRYSGLSVGVLALSGAHNVHGGAAVSYNGSRRTLWSSWTSLWR